MTSEYGSFDDESRVESNCIQQQRLDEKGNACLDIVVFIPPDGAEIDAKRLRVVDDFGDTISVDQVVIPKAKILQYEEPERPKKQTIAQKREYEGRLSKVRESNELISIAQKIDELDLSEDDKLQMLWKSTKLKRAVRMIEVAMTTPGNTALRALERIRDEEDGRPASRRPGEDDDDLDGINFEVI